MRPYAVDFYPGREPVYGVPMKIMILGVDQHAEIIRQKLESLQARVEELARLQEKISAQTAALEQGKLDSKEATRRTEELKEAQEQTASQLKKMSEDGASTLKEAMRNPSLDAAKLEEWNKAMAEMKRIAESPMKGAAEKLAAAASPSSDRKEKVDEAREKQKGDERRARHGFILSRRPSPVQRANVSLNPFSRAPSRPAPASERACRAWSRRASRPRNPSAARTPWRPPSRAVRSGHAR